MIISIAIILLFKAQVLRLPFSAAELEAMTAHRKNKRSS